MTQYRDSIRRYRTRGVDLRLAQRSAWQATGIYPTFGISPIFLWIDKPLCASYTGKVTPYCRLTSMGQRRRFTNILDVEILACMNLVANPLQTQLTHPLGLTIRLLGDFALTYGGLPITAVNTPRLCALLAYLLLHRQAPQSRRHLAFLFWPDSTEAQALTNLRKQLLYLRQVLPDCDRLLAMDRQGVHWLPGAAIEVDVERFREALAAAATLTDSQAIPVLRQAVACYTGELLPACYDDWIFAEREALHTQYGHALDRLSGLLEAQRDYANSIVYGEQLLRHDPLHEPTYRRLMRLHALNGDRPAALRVYHTCLTQLREELGVDPDAETQGVYERLLQGAAVTTAQPELAAYAPFVSRQTEWQTLQQRWRLAQRGQPQFVLIAGEAGIGKTRLAEELLAWAIHQGFCTARARCYAAEGRLTYAPVIEWLRSERLRTARPKIENTWLSKLARLLPEILQEHPTVRPPEPITQSWQRHHLFEAVSRALLAVDQPLVLLIDDLQWCDKETLELLHFLLRHAAAHGQSHLMLVGTARLPDEVDAAHPLYELLNPLRGSNTLTQLDLARLTEVETGELARQMMDRPLDSQTLQQLFRDTAGNPLFVVETLRATQGQFNRNGSSGQLTPAPFLPIAESEAIIQYLPPKVLAVIQARLGHLSATALELCEWAAIVGRAFTLDLLICASKIDPGKAVNALDELWRRRIVREQGGDAYDFSHDRIRDVAAAGISRVRRRYLHRCVAETLESQSTNQVESSATSIAAHYDAAGMVEKAIHFYQGAAKYAPQVYANHEALTYLQRAITLLKTLPESSERDQHELVLLNALIPSFVAVTNYAVAQLREIYERVYVLSQKLATPFPPVFLRILAIHKVGKRDFQQAEELGQQLIALSQQDADDAKLLHLQGCYVLGVAAFWQGHFAQAGTYFQQVVDTYALVQQEHHITTYGHDTGIYCRARLGWTLWYLGYPEQARQQCAQAAALAGKLQHPVTLYLGLAHCVWCACNLRDVRVVESLLHTLYAQSAATATQEMEVFRFFDGWRLLLNGNTAEALTQLINFATLARAFGTDALHYPHTIALLAEAYRCNGGYAQGLVTLTEALDLLAHNQNYWYIAEIYRLQGELLIGQGAQVAEAEACFQQALVIARRQQAKSLELRAAMSLGRLWAQQGKDKEAHALLTEIYHWFTEGFDTPDLQEAKALLATLA